MFLCAGIFGHDPWKQDETYSFGIIYHFYTTHNWLVPVNAGVPFMEKPPLYYWTAVLFCEAFGGFLPLHDAARFASLLYAGISVYFIWQAAQILSKESRDIWLCLLLFLGSLGIVRHSHDMFTDVALLAGSTIALYGIIHLVCRNGSWLKSGLALGIGIGVAFLSKGLFIPGLLTISVLSLLLILPAIRTRDTLRALFIALLAAAPFLFIWPLLLYSYSYDLFMEWFWDNNVGRFLGFSVPQLGADNKPYYILYSVLWFAFPVFPLAVIAVWRGRKQWKNPEYLVPVLVSLLGIAFLSISASARALYLMPFVPAFAILAVRGLKEVPEKFLMYWNKGVCFLCGTGVAVMWLVWFGLLTGHPLPGAGQVLPLDFSPEHTQWLAVIVSAFATLFCLSIFLRDGNTPAAAAHVWFAGVATLWITMNTLLLPWIDETKSYRPVLAQMNAYINSSSYKNDCMNVYRLGESIAPMLEYFGDSHGGHQLNTIDGFSYARCAVAFTVTGKTTPETIVPGWNLIWRGSRILDAKDEELRLYVRRQ